MKKNRIIFFKIFVILFVSIFSFSCDEEERGPLVTDGVAPDPITEVIVTNLHGGAKIEYKLPSTEDALFVQATYIRNGKEVTTSTSVFDNSVTLEGLRSTSTQEVKLQVVDRSNNKSSTVLASINPLEAPIDKMHKTIDLLPAFGGVGFSYDNSDNIQVEVLLYVKDPASNLYIYNQSLFLTQSDAGGIYTFRSFPPEAQDFAIEMVDRYDNITERYIETITPIEEVELDRQEFTEAKLTGDIETGAFGWVFNNIFNNNIGGSGMHTSQTSPGEVVPPYTESYHIFTIDLNVTRKLSRFIWWHRQGDWAFHHGNPRFYDIWVTDVIPADNGASLDGWTLIQEAESIKPSGTPSGFGQATPADRERAALGETIEFPLTIPPMRYIRFVTKRNWANAKFVHLMEVEVYGSPE